jgi:diacylglycerol kinase
MSMRFQEKVMQNSTNVPSSPPERVYIHPAHRARAAWREGLVRVERGLVRGIRCDSAFFVHFFGISIVIAAALVLGIGWMQWTAIVGCLTLVLTAQMFNQALKSLAYTTDETSTPHVERALAIGTAAVLVSCTGSTLILAVIFWHRIYELFAG